MEPRPQAHPHTTNHPNPIETILSCPGKVLIMGGYAILKESNQGTPAPSPAGIILATGSRFFSRSRTQLRKRTIQLTQKMLIP